ncbi:unnamed protein product [Effrenium voratum]|nr:unnamed protein product [Effrenium voratum]
MAQHPNTLSVLEKKDALRSAGKRTGDQEREDATKVEEVKGVTPKKDDGISFAFKLPDNTITEVHFEHRPLGLDFSKTIPMTVKAVKQDSVAEQKKVQPKWIITHVQGQALPETFPDAMQKIFDAVQSLPMQR